MISVTTAARRMLVIALIVVTTMLGVTLAGCSNSKPPPAASRPAAGPAGDASNWMQANLDAIGTLRLDQLLLPASHDASMYQKSFPQFLARTQSLSIYGQLDAGVRWFDLRPRWRGGRFSMCHGPIDGPAVDTVLEDVRRYMAEGHHELVLLKFSHDDGFSDPVYRSLTAAIKARLDPWLWRSTPPGKRLADIPLRDYVGRSGVVLVLCDGRYPVGNPADGIWVYRDWDSRDAARGDLRVFDQYANTTSYDAMKADQSSKFAAYDGRCLHQPDVACDLFLLSWTLTPQTDVPTYAAVANRHLADAAGALQTPNRFGKQINLLYADEVSATNVTPICVRENLRRAMR